MHSSSNRGNNPELWTKLLEGLDDKLQLGLLDHLKRVQSYHFEDNTLTIQPGSEDDEEYLTRGPVQKQLELFAEDFTGAQSVTLEKP